MLLKNKPVNAHISQQKADELIGYLYLLIDELQQKYCQKELTKFIDNLDEEALEKGEEITIEFNERIPF